MSGVSLLDNQGRLVWSSCWLDEFPAGSCQGRSIWDLSFGEYRERIKTAFGLAAAVRERQHHQFGFLSPVTSKPVDFDVTYEPAPPDVAVVARWRKALSVSVLNDQERAVLVMLCEDESPKEISKRLGIHETTVGRIRDAIRAKTGARGPAGEVLAAIRMRLIQVPMDEDEP